MLHLPWASTKVRNIRSKIELVQKVCRWDISREIQIVHTKYICLWQNFDSALLQNVNEIGWFCGKCKNIWSAETPLFPLPILPILLFLSFLSFLSFLPWLLVRYSSHTTPNIFESNPTFQIYEKPILQTPIWWQKINSFCSKWKLKKSAMNIINVDSLSPSKGCEAS